jgi:hypothetical protein
VRPVRRFTNPPGHERRPYRNGRASIARTWYASVWFTNGSCRCNDSLPDLLLLCWGNLPRTLAAVSLVWLREARVSASLGRRRLGGIGVAGKALVGSTGYGVWGEAFSSAVDGLHGIAHTQYSGVAGLNDGTGYGVFGEAFGAALDGVHGVTNNASGSGVAGVDLAAGDGIFGGSTGGFAGYATSPGTSLKEAVPSRSTIRSILPANTSITLSSNHLT